MTPLFGPVSLTLRTMFMYVFQLDQSVLLLITNQNIFLLVLYAIYVK